MDGQDVKLLGVWFSPFVHRVEWALKLKGVDYELIPESNLKYKSPLLLECNPIHKKIPVLLHAGNSISESLLIIEYIDETWKPNPILPTNPLDKATARFWASFIDNKLTDATRKALYMEGEELGEQARKVREAMGVLEEELRGAAGKKFFGGDAVGFVDIVLGWITKWLEGMEEVLGVKFFNAEEHPLMEEWKKEFAELGFVKDSLLPKEKVVEFFQKYRRSALKTARKTRSTASSSSSLDG